MAGRGVAKEMGSGWFGFGGDTVDFESINLVHFELLSPGRIH